jgi:sugar O-acyltransferase (sialic acid O-acetyltransferase NeuD family)
MANSKQLIIVGDSAFAEVAYEYFTHDSDYQVVAFSVERAYRNRETLFGLDVVPLEELDAHYSPTDHDVFVAIVYTQLNRLRVRLCQSVKTKGYKLARYVSSKAFVWHNVTLGENCFVFEDNTVQPFVKIGDNVVLWSGNHIGHHSVIRDNVFISSHVVISGFVDVGENGFLGVNAAIGNNLKIAKDNWIGPGVTITKDTEPGNMFVREKTIPARISALRFFKVKE